jgi:indolepyruvate ferredoxin oxidoreductase beta subunit
VSEPRVLSVLIPAVGGQGGGVLLDWVVDAALIDGYPVHGTSIPGVAQRTGSTTYYIELCSARDAEPPVFSLYPVPGALDVLLAAEFLEVGRMIEQGFPSPARTTIVASTHRLYSIHEKVVTGRGIYPSEDLQRAARAFSRALYAFDALALARENGTEANAVLLGALGASGALPIRADAFREAIRRKGVQVDANLRGFDAGLVAVERLGAAAGAGAGAALEASERHPPTSPAPAPRPGSDGRAVASTDAGAARMTAGFPAELRPVLGQAIERLTEYQNRAYAERYLARLRPFVALDDVTLQSLLARSLAVWMTYEDAIRVAQLKTRWSRFERIRREQGVARGEIVVTDYLKPDLDEIWGILPRRLVAPFARWAERRWPRGRPTLAQHVRTTTVTGYLRVWFLTFLRPLRPISYRAHEEHARMERWLAAVARCAAWDLPLAREVARAAQLVKGYGDVRRRMAGHFDRLLAGVMRVAELEAANGGGFEAARTLAARYRTLVLQGPEGEVRAAALAAEALAR